MWNALWRYLHLYRAYEMKDSFEALESQTKNELVPLWLKSAIKYPDKFLQSSVCLWNQVEPNVLVTDGH